MPSVALDLSPVVSALLEHPFEQSSLDEAYAAVGRHPQAYATALRCAAKKAPDGLAAARWFAEAARVHESMDDLGGAIALLFRALECDPGNPRPREKLAAMMVRLAVRAGLGFSFTPGAVPAADATPLETGLRPPPPERRDVDHAPDLFDPSSDKTPPAGVRVSDVVPRAVVPSVIVTLSESPSAKAQMVAPAEPHPGDASVDTFPGDVSADSPKSAPPPSDPESMTAIPLSRAIARGAPVPRAAPPPKRSRGKASSPKAAAKHDAGRVAQLLPPPKALAVVEPVEAPSSRRASGPRPTEAAPPPSLESVPPGEPDDLYAEHEAPATLRPTGDRLVGGLFEALHSLHFLEDVRAGAVFLGRTISEKMKPATTLVHLYDINSGHFVVVSAEGSRATALLDYATPEDDPFIAEVMKNEDSTQVDDPAGEPRLSRGRWLLVEPKCSVLCAPVASEGRHLGLIELADPVDGGKWGDDDRNALTYAASALARFLDRRGLVLSDEPELSSPGPLPAL
jgi:hypothetical protein